MAYRYDVSLGRPVNGVYESAELLVVGDLRAFERQSKKRWTDAWAYHLSLSEPFDERRFYCVQQTKLIDPTRGRRYKFSGLFARKDIPNGAYLLVYEGPYITDKRAEQLKGNCYLFDVVKGRRLAFVIDGEDPNHSGMGRYVNTILSERDKLNVAFQTGRSSGEPVIFLRAIRDIKAGEELYAPYGEQYKLEQCKAARAIRPLEQEWADRYKC